LLCKCAPGFISQPAVANGASELFMHIWGDAGVAARSALGVAELPLNSPVEVELTVESGLTPNYFPRFSRRSTSVINTARPSSLSHPRPAKSARALFTVSRDAPTS